MKDFQEHVRRRGGPDPAAPPSHEAVRAAVAEGAVSVVHARAAGSGQDDGGGLQGRASHRLRDSERHLLRAVRALWAHRHAVDRSAPYLEDMRGQIAMDMAQIGTSPSRR